MSGAVGLFSLGLFLLLLGGGSVLEHALALADKLRLPPLVVGSAVAAVGTTLPELAVTMSAAMSSQSELAVGTAAGSAVCVCCLVGGLCCLISPVKKMRRRDAAGRLLYFLLGVCFTALSAVKTGRLDVGLAAVLLSILAVYAVTNAASATVRPSPERAELICAGLLIGGAALYLGSGLVIDAAVLAAELIGIGHRAMGTVFIAFGASLPELFTVMAALRRGKSEEALGTAVGAGVLNVLLTLGLPAAAAPITAPRRIYRLLAASAAGMGALLVPPALTGRTFRWQGAALILMYAGFIALELTH